MPYIGKSPVGGGFHKLDALTASATDTYSLTLGGASYFPETANQLLCSLNGIIQAPQDSFQVSGSNLIFDSALTASDSIDFVVALGDVLGVQGVTDGAVTTAKIGNGAVTAAKLAAGVQGVAGITSSSTSGTALSIDANNIVSMPSTVMYDTYRLTTDHTTSSIITAWEKPDNTILTTVGDSMSVSSGAFSFPKTGVYRVTYHAVIDSAAADSVTSVELWATTDNSTYERIVYVREGGGSSIDYGSVYGEAIININDVANRKVQLQAGSVATGSIINGNTDRNETYICFQYLAPAQ